MGPYRDLERADRIATAAQHVAGLHRGDALGRAGVVYVARIERVERRGEFDETADVVDQVLRIRGLFENAIVGKRDLEVVRIGDFIGRHEPGAKYRIAINGFPEAAVFAAAAGHVEAERITRDIVLGLVLGDIGPLLADYRHQFDLVLVGAIEKADRDAFRGP